MIHEYSVHHFVSTTSRALIALDDGEDAYDTVPWSTLDILVLRYLTCWAPIWPSFLVGVLWAISNHQV